MEEQQVEYFPKFEENNTSIIYALNALHIDSGFYNRGKIAEANGIKNYTGRVIENMKIMQLLKDGKLIKP